MSNGESTLGRLRAFAHVNAEKVQQYRAIMRVFMEAKARFAIHLRPPESSTASGERTLLEKTRVFTSALAWRWSAES